MTPQLEDDLRTPSTLVTGIVDYNEVGVTNQLSYHKSALNPFNPHFPVVSVRLSLLVIPNGGPTLYRFGVCLEVVKQMPSIAGLCLDFINEIYYLGSVQNHWLIGDDRKVVF